MSTLHMHAQKKQTDLITIFESIMKNKDDCKIALKQPSLIFQKYGIHVPDPVATDAVIFTVAPQLRAHFLAVASGKEHYSPLEMCSGGGAGCIACKAGFGITLVGLIPIAIAGGAEAAGAILAIAEATGLASGTISAIIVGVAGGGLGSAIDSICNATGAC